MTDAAILTHFGFEPRDARALLRRWLKGKGLDRWTRCFQTLKPGGHLLAYAGGYEMDLVSMAIRLARFEVRDAIAVLRETPGGLPPAWGLYLLARKPLDGTVAENVVRHGTGALHIDVCRIGTEGGTKRSHQAGYVKADGSAAMWRTGHEIVDIGKGRWPANIVTDGSRQVEAIFGGFGDRVSRSTDGKVYDDRSLNAVYGRFANSPMHAGNTYDDEGSVMRYFHVAPSTPDLLNWLARLVTPPGGTIYAPDEPLLVKAAVDPVMKVLG